MNSSNITALRMISLHINSKAALGNSILLFMAIIALYMSISQSLVVIFHKPLRNCQQILVVNAAMADAAKSLSCLIIAIERLYLAAVEKDEVTNQHDCITWLLAFTFSLLYGLCSVLTLSMERLGALTLPIWYWKNKRSFIFSLTLICLIVSAAGALASYAGVSTNRFMPTCNLVSATAPQYYDFLVYAQDVTTSAIVLVNCGTAFSLIRRWRTAAKSGVNMNEFKKEIQLNAVKAVFSVVVLCLFSFFGGDIFLRVLQGLDPDTRAQYGPFWGCLQLLRGTLDFGLWLTFNEKYRKGFATVFLKRKCIINRVYPSRMQAPKVKYDQNGVQMATIG